MITNNRATTSYTPLSPQTGYDRSRTATCLGGFLLIQDDRTRGVGRLYTRGLVRLSVSEERETRNKGTADPIIIKHATTDLGEDVSSGRLERSVDVGSALGARLGEEQSFLLCPSFPLLGRDLSSIDREITGEPGPCVFKT